MITNEKTLMIRLANEIRELSEDIRQAIEDEVEIPAGLISRIAFLDGYAAAVKAAFADE